MGCTVLLVFERAVESAYLRVSMKTMTPAHGKREERADSTPRRLGVGYDHQKVGHLGLASIFQVKMIRADLADDLQ